MPDSGFPQWLDNTELGAIGALTLNNGEHMTAELIELNEELNEIVVEIISPKNSPSGNSPDRRSIPVTSVVSFNPEPREIQEWPHSDPCRNRSFSSERFLLMTTLFLGSILGGFALFMFLRKVPYGLQSASIATYTIAEIFLTFAATGRSRSYLFTCPAVERQIPRLLWRHLGFLAALFALQTTAQKIHPYLPDWWNVPDRKGSTPFELVLLLLCLGLGCIQVLTNRSLLARAHKEFIR